MSKSRNVDFNEDDYALYTELTNEELIRNTYAYRAEAKGKAEGLAEGETKGKEENQLENAKNAIKLGLSDEDISKITGLNVEKIKTLRK